MENIKLISDIGFTAFFAVSVLAMVFKYLPKLISEWAKFTAAIHKNTEVTDKHYGETIDLKTQLLDLKKQLEAHDSEKKEMRQDLSRAVVQNEEIMAILKEMMEIVRKKP